MDLHLAGKRALVTGGSKGIGLATALILAEESCDLVLVARDTGDLARAAARIGDRVAVATIAADLSRGEDVARVAAAIDTLDILVNNAGAIPPGDLLTLDEARWREAWDLKVFGYSRSPAPSTPS